MIELYPLASSDLAATVCVNVGAEVFRFTFAGHDSHDFAYDDDDRLETLREPTDLAAQAITGPTRIILEQAGDVIIQSTMILNPDSPDSRQDVVSYPVRRLKSLLQRHRVTRTTADFPSTRDS